MAHEIHGVGHGVYPGDRTKERRHAGRGIERSAQEQQGKQHHVDHASEVLHRAEPCGDQESKQAAGSSREHQRPGRLQHLEGGHLQDERSER